MVIEALMKLWFCFLRAFCCLFGACTGFGASSGLFDFLLLVNVLYVSGQNHDQKMRFTRVFVPLVA